jgi:hypothetical protein
MIGPSTPLRRRLAEEAISDVAVRRSAGFQRTDPLVPPRNQQLVRG